MEVLIVEALRFRPEIEVIEQEVIDSMRSCNRIQTDDARIRLLRAICLLLSFLVRLCFLREDIGVDELITPEASMAWAHRAVRAHYIDQRTAHIRPDLRPELNARNQILMDERVKDQPRAHGIRG